MKTKLFILFCLAGFIAKGQPNWLSSAGGNSNDEATKICSGINGEIYTCGYFSASASFDGTVLSSAGSRDIFITKQNAAGEVQWVKRAGGALSDKPYGIATDADGNIFVTGYYTSQASFGATTLTSANSSQDIFLVKLNDNGDFLWAKSYGGPDIDLSSGIACDSSGNVIITGQFTGTAQFGASSYTSLTNPFTNDQTYDIFILKADANGNTLWSKHGKGKYDDRGLSVSTGGQGNIYLTGQFSENITFSQLYTNNAFNASYVMKLDANGNEKWFRKIYATQVLAYDIDFRNNKLLLTGNFQGQLYFSGTTPTLYNNNYYNKIFLAKLDTTGTVEWIKGEGSSSALSSYSVAVDPDGNSYITGTFECTLGSLSSLYGPAIFKSIGGTDVFMCKFNANGERIWQRHFAGPRDDMASGIAVFNQDMPYICGSFERNFNVPSDPSFASYTTNHDSTSFGPAQNSGICGDSYYRDYISVSSAGNKDILLAKPYSSGRQLYDAFDRSSCEYSIPQGMINNGEDSLFSCQPVQLTLNTRTGMNGVIGPEFIFEWSNNAVSQNIYASTTGWYKVHAQTRDECYSFTDSIFVTIYAVPPKPEILYSTGTLKQAIPGCLDKLTVMLPDTAVLTATNLLPGYNFYWQKPSGIDTAISVTAASSGIYTIISEAPRQTCENTTCIEVKNYILDTLGTCNGTVGNPIILFTDSTHEASDTVRVCEDELFELILLDSAHSSTGVYTIGTFADWELTGGYTFEYYLSFPSTFNYHGQRFRPLASGNCTVTAYLLNPVTLNPEVTVSRNFYLKVDPKPTPSVNISGPAMFCPGDTVTLTITGGDNYIVNGPSIISTNNDSSIITVTKSGTYYASWTVTDSITGCTNSGTASFNLASPSEPVMVMTPSNGVVCPGDSVLLTAEQGSNWHWYGPNGSVIGTTQSIYVNNPGDYHYDMINPNGCFLVSAYSEVKEYTTPFIAAEPSAVLCPGSSVTLTVFSTDTTSMVWSGPLGLTGTSITVSDTGLYTCNVTGCGVVSQVSVSVTASTLQAEIIPSGPVTLCANGTALLQTETGLESYSWMPGNGSTASFTVNNAGTYVLKVTDEHTCQSTDTVEVIQYPVVPVPLTSDTTICYNTSAVLYATSAYNMIWINNLDTVIGNGPSLHTGALHNDTSVFVFAADSVCPSEKVEVHVYINDVSRPFNIIGDSVLCEGDTLALGISMNQQATYTWVVPSGFTNNSQMLVINSVDSINSGSYSLVLSDSLCSSSDSIAVSVQQVNEFSITGPAEACEGSTFTLMTDARPNSNYTWNLADGTVIQGPYCPISSAEQADQGYYMLKVIENNCPSPADTHYVDIIQVPVFTITGDSVYCRMQGVQLSTTYSGGIISWTSQLGAATGNNYYASAANPGTTYVTATVTDSGCSAQKSKQLTIHALPYVSISTTGTSCSGDSITLWTQGQPLIQYTWSGPVSTTGSSLSLLSSTAYEGTYTVIATDTNGCRSNAASYELNVTPYPVIDIPALLVVCEDSTATIVAAPGADLYEWNGSAGEHIFTTTDTGLVIVTVTNGNSCSVTDSTHIQSIDCTVDFPNMFTPNGDGRNDIYQLLADQGTIEEFLIVNRWGIIIKEFRNEKVYWDGRTNGGEEAAPGVYYFTATVKENNSTRLVKGFIELIR